MNASVVLADGLDLSKYAQARDINNINRESKETINLHSSTICTRTRKRAHVHFTLNIFYYTYKINNIRYKIPIARYKNVLKVA